MQAGGARRWRSLFCAFAYSAHFLPPLETFGGTLLNVRNDPQVPRSAPPDPARVPARATVYWLHPHPTVSAPAGDLHHAHLLCIKMFGD